jgi:uncharacterized protein (DUF1015 family)
VSGLPEGWAPKFFDAAKADFEITEIDSFDALRAAWESDAAGNIGLAIGPKLYLLRARDQADRAGDSAAGSLDVVILHELLLAKALGITPDAVRNEQFLRYIRGIDSAVELARTGAAQAAFLLKPTSVQQVADTSFAGGVMPQKSTDFYPKLLSGLAIYKVD